MNVGQTLTLVKKLINKKTISLFFIVLVLYFIGTRNSQDSKKIQIAKAQTKDIISNVSASGTINSESEATVHFQAAGNLSWIGIKQGDHVQKYQAIAKLDTLSLEKNLKKDLNLYLTQRTNFDDTQLSQKDQAITDTLKRIAQRAQYSLENTVSDVEIQDLAIKYSTIYSPIDGYVVNNPQFFAGNNILVTDTIATIDDLDNLQFVAEVDETDVAKAHDGQVVSLTLDAFPDKKFAASIDRIIPKSVTTSTGATAFQAIIKLTDTQDLKVGMNGTAQVEIDKAESAITVPQEAIYQEKYVFVKSGKKFVQKEIEKGIESDTEIQIKSGVEANETVVTSGFDELKKGSIFQKFTGAVS